MPRQKVGVGAIIWYSSVIKRKVKVMYGEYQRRRGLRTESRSMPILQQGRSREASSTHGESPGREEAIQGSVVSQHCRGEQASRREEEERGQLYPVLRGSHKRKIQKCL